MMDSITQLSLAIDGNWGAWFTKIGVRLYGLELSLQDMPQLPGFSCIRGYQSNADLPDSPLRMQGWSVLYVRQKRKILITFFFGVCGPRNTG